MRYKAIGILFSLLFISRCLLAQEPAVKVFNAKNGLTGTSFGQIAQGVRGNLWIATNQGLAKYNGYRFINFNADAGIEDEKIVSVKPTANGDIWAIANNGGLYKIAKDSVFPFDNNHLLKKQLIHTMQITSLAIDNGDTMWLGVNNADFYLKLTPISGTFSVKKIPIRSKAFIGLKQNQFFYSINPSAANNDLQVTGNNYNFSITVKEKIKTLSAAYNKNNLLVSCNHFVLDGKTLQQTDLYDNINQLYFDDNNNNTAWILFENLGLAIGQIKNFKDVNVIIKNINFQSFMRDYEGGVWLGSNDKGLFYIPEFSVSLINKENGLDDEQINAVTSNNNLLIFATVSGHVYSLKGSRIIELYNVNKNSVTQNAVNTLYIDKDENIWIGTMQGAYFIKKNTTALLPIINNGKPLNNVKKIIDNGQLGVWIASEGTLGTAQWRNSKLQYTEHPVHSKINTLVIDEGNNLWLGCNNGLWKYNQRYFKFFGYNNRWLKNKITALAFDADNQLWVGTQNTGVLSVKGNSIKHYTRFNGLLDNEIKSIVINNNKTPVIASAGGYSYILKNKIKTHLYKSVIDVNDVRQLSAYKNNLVFATYKGLMIVSDSVRQYPAKLLSTHVSTIFVNDKKVVFTDHLPMVLEPDKNSLKFDFNAPSFKNLGRTLYRYKLGGLQEDWQYTYSTSLYFPKLNQGKYHLQIQAKNFEGKWGTDAPQLTFEIKAPFYEKPWFILLLGVVIALISAWVVNWQLNKKHLKVLQQETLKRKLIDLELQALRSQMNPHFIFNSINSIQHFIVGNHPAEAQKYLSKFAKLMRNVLDNSKTSHISLEKELQTIELYLQLESLRFEDHFDFEINTNPTIDAGYTEVPSMLIQPYVENAIWHGLMHKQGKGKITISLKKNNNTLQCTIEDDGIGRKKAQEYKSKNKITHKSLGMTITKERLQILNNLNANNLSVVITDLSDEKDMPTGTKVDIFIPIN